MKGESEIRCIRLVIHDEKGCLSVPYLFCSACRSSITDEQFNFCPWCGWKFTKRQVQTISVDKSELIEKGIDFGNIVDYVRGKVKWK